MYGSCPFFADDCQGIDCCRSSLEDDAHSLGRDDSLELVEPVFGSFDLSNYSRGIFAEMAHWQLGHIWSGSIRTWDCDNCDLFQGKRTVGMVCYVVLPCDSVLRGIQCFLDASLFSGLWSDGDGRRVGSRAIASREASLRKKSGGAIGGDRRGQEESPSALVFVRSESASTWFSSPSASAR